MGRAARVFSARFVSPSAHAGERVFSVRFVACGASFQRPFLVVFRGRFCPYSRAFLPLFLSRVRARATSVPAQFFWLCSPPGARFYLPPLGKAPGVCGLQKASGQHPLWWCLSPLLKGTSTSRHHRKAPADKQRSKNKVRARNQPTGRVHVPRGTPHAPPQTADPVTAHGADRTPPPGRHRARG
jgi:hypothetical protein